MPDQSEEAEIITMAQETPKVFLFLRLQLSE